MEIEYQILQNRRTKRYTVFQFGVWKVNGEVRQRLPLQFYSFDTKEEAQAKIERLKEFYENPFGLRSEKE